MKTRTGFVSNSSSASFIVHWRMRTFGEKVDVKEAIAKVVGLHIKEDGEIDWENSWRNEDKPKIEEMIEKTVINSDGSFTSTFWTDMYNDAEDFGEAAVSMVMNMVVDNNNFQIVDSKVETDH